MNLRKIHHHSKKHDGSIHYRYDVDVIAESPGCIAVFREPDAMLESYRGTFSSGFSALSIYYTEAFYNVTVGWNEGWTPRMHYVNIASPASWGEKRLEWIDYDLDLILRARDGEIIIDDEDEFEHHIEKFAYPPRLVERCRRELERIHEAMKKRIGIFDERVFAWRPGDPVPETYLSPL